MQYTFGTYRLDTERQEVHHHGSSVFLQPKMSQVLLYLIEHRERIVTKDELFEHAWADIYVGDAALTQCIAALRKALGDDGKAQAVIRTYHRQGYRFVAPVQVEAAPAATVSEPAPAATPAPLMAERRQLTVLWCTVTVGDAPAASSDPEVLYDGMQRWRSACLACIAEFDGHVAQQTSEGLVVYFGYPQAHEDDARRALRTGLALLRRLQQAASVAETAWSIRVGIHTGFVITEASAAPARPGAMAVGATPLIASRLCALAPASSVLISDPTARLVAGYFTLKPLEPQVLLEHAEALPVYDVRGPSGFQSRLAVEAVAGLTPFVSREAELALLRDRWRQMREGQGQVVVVRGEAGIGKSRLLHEWKEALAEIPHIWIECRGSPYHQNTAFYPLVELLHRALDWQSTDDETAKGTKLAAFLEPYGLNLDESVSLLARLLALPLPGGGEAPFALNPQQRQRLLEVLGQLVVVQATTHPVVFLVEDMHWIDPSTLDVIHLLMAQAPLIRLLVVVTCRPTFAWPEGPQTAVTPLALTRLTESQTAHLITQVAGDKPLPAAVMTQLVTKADGVPLYVEELTRMVLESGQLRETADHYELRDRLAPLTVPSTLQDSLMARLDRLGDGKAVAQWGAVLGREFQHEVLAAVTAFEAERLHAGLQSLLQAELLQQRGVGPHVAYRFRHALLQEAAYASILQRQRRQMHTRIAHVLETHFADLVAAQPEVAAQHHQEAEHLEPAVAAWHHAGRLASERSAYVEAVRHLTQGLTLLAALRETAETPARLQQELMLHVALGPALVATKGFGAPEVEQTYTRARALCQRLGNVAELFPILGGLWRCYMGRQDLRPIRQLADEILAVAEAAPDRSLLVEAYRVQGMSRFSLGDLQAARDVLEQCIALYDPVQHRDHLARYGGAAAGVSALAYLANILWLLGYPAQAEARSAQALRLAQALEHPFSLGFALAFATNLAYRLQQPQAVQTHAERLIAVARAAQLPFWVTWGLVRRGWALVVQGQVAEGLAQLQDTWATRAHTTLHYHHVVMAAAYGQAGQVAEGLAILDDLLTTMEVPGEAYWRPEVYLLKGDLLRQHHPAQDEPAAVCWQQALALSRRQQARSLELRAATRLARLWQRQRRPEAAQALLAPIYHTFTEGFDTRDLQEADAVLKTLAT